MRKRTFGVIMGALLLMLLAAPAYGQTRGTKIPGADVNRETWTVTIAASDSISTYFTIPVHTEKIMISFPALTTGLIFFQAAIDSSRVPGGSINSTFRVIRLNTAKQDSIAQGSGAFIFDATDILKGTLAARIETDGAQGSTVTIRVFIRKKPPE